MALEKAYQFVLWLVPIVGKFPRSHKFLLGDRIQAAALDVLKGLLEVTYTRNRVPVLRGVNLKLEKLRLLFRFATDLQILDVRRYEHAEHAQTWRLRPAIFRGGPFDPARDPLFRDCPSGPKRKPGQSPPATASAVAAPGMTFRGSCARRTATGTNPRTGTTISASALPARS